MPLDKLTSTPCHTHDSFRFPSLAAWVRARCPCSCCDLQATTDETPQPEWRIHVNTYCTESAVTMSVSFIGASENATGWFLIFLSRCCIPAIHWVHQSGCPHSHVHCGCFCPSFCTIAIKACAPTLSVPHAGPKCG